LTIPSCFKSAPPPPPPPACPPAPLPPPEEAARARDYLRALRHALAAHISGRDYDVHRLITHYTAQIDRIISDLYQRCISDPRVRLYAIGGYGRGELFPASDIDLLLLTPDDSTDRDAIETFIQTLWQLGLDIAQHVHRASDLNAAATADIDLLTSRREARRRGGGPPPRSPPPPAAHSQNRLHPPQTAGTTRARQQTARPARTQPEKRQRRPARLPDD